MMIFDIRSRALIHFRSLKGAHSAKDQKGFTCVGPEAGAVRSARGSFAESFPFGFKRRPVGLKAKARQGADQKKSCERPS
jgi:hypothetical protein